MGVSERSTILFRIIILYSIIMLYNTKMSGRYKLSSNLTNCRSWKPPPTPATLTLTTECSLTPTPSTLCTPIPPTQHTPPIPHTATPRIPVSNSLYYSARRHSHSRSHAVMGSSGSCRVWGYDPTCSWLRCRALRPNPIGGRAGLDHQTARSDVLKLEIRPARSYFRYLKGVGWPARYPGTTTSKVMDKCIFWERWEKNLGRSSNCGWKLLHDREKMQVVDLTAGLR
jgi:hypothetical protein